jgi:hypothetical protein
MAILYPTFALVALTLFFVSRMGMMRFSAVRRGEVDGRYYRLYRGYEEPEHLRVLTRHVINLYEAPVLFYVVSLIAYVTDTVSTLILVMAWAYVALRYAHSYVHLTTNKVINRFRVFVVSHVMLIALWVVVLVSLPH